jgi:hypothetical protein
MGVSFAYVSFAFQACFFKGGNVRSIVNYFFCPIITGLLVLWIYDGMKDTKQNPVGHGPTSVSTPLVPTTKSEGEHPETSTSVQPKQQVETKERVEAPQQPLQQTEDVQKEVRRDVKLAEPQVNQYTIKTELPPDTRIHAVRAFVEESGTPVGIKEFFVRADNLVIITNDYYPKSQILRFEWDHDNPVQRLQGFMPGGGRPPLPRPTGPTRPF